MPPIVPVYRTRETFQAAPAANPASVRLRDAQGIVSDLGQIGQGVQQVLGNIDKANLLNFNNGLTAAKQQLLNDPDNGYLNKQNIDAIDGKGQVQQQWEQSVQAAMQGLPKHLQAHAQQIAAEQTLNFNSDVDKHVSTQMENYQDTVDTQSLNMAQSEALLNYGDQARVEQQADAAATVAAMQAKRKGLPVDVAEQQARSGIYQAVIERQAQNDPIGAQKRYYDLLDAGDLTGQAAMQLDQMIRPVVQDQRARTITDVINNGGVFDAGADPSSVDDFIVGMESGEDANAKNPSSSATGAGQFIDSTWLAQVKKNRPDLASGKNDADILAMRRDKKLSKEMVSAYREDNTERLRAAGVPASASNIYASHYFGPAGGVAFAKADDATPMSKILSADQISANPNLNGKTKGQVLAAWRARGMPEVGGSISYSSPAQTKMEAMERTRTISDPSLRRAVERNVREEWELREAQQAQAAQQQSESIRQSIVNGASSGNTLAQIMGPAAYAQAVRSGEIEKWQDFRTKVVAGYIVQDNPALVDELGRQAALDPDAFSKRDISGLANQLSTSTLTSLLNKQSDIRSNGDSAVKDYMSEEDRLNSGFTMLGIGKDGDATGQGSSEKNSHREQLRGQFRLAYQNAYTTFMQQSQGKKPTPEQADTLLRTVAKQFAPRMASGDLGVTRNDDGSFKPNPDRKVGLYSNAAAYQLQVSEADRAAVRNAYKSKYGVQPTDAWVTEYIARKRGSVNQ